MSFEIPTGSGVDWSGALASVQAELVRRQTGKEILSPKTLNDDEWVNRAHENVYAWREKQLLRFEQDDKYLKSAKAWYKDRPIEFINHWCDVFEPRNNGTGNPTWMPFTMFTKQEEFVYFINDCVDKQQPGLAEKSRTMGATWICVGWSVHRWLFHSGSVIGWGSQDAPTVDRLGDHKSIFEKLRSLIRRLPAYFLPGDIGHEHLKQYVCLNSDNGSSIVGEVGDNIGRGGRSLVYFLDEAAHVKRPEKIEASLSENTNVPISISSVNGLGNLFHRKREGGVEWSVKNKDELPNGYVRVFVMDWSDHPSYDQKWFDEKKSLAVRQGTAHIFAQEIERNYAASVEGVIIPLEHINAAVDAHIALGFDDSGGWSAALDVADEGRDRNAYADKKGVVLKWVEEWSKQDTSKTARRAVALAQKRGSLELQYDCIGVGAGVKGEANRLKDEGKLPKGLDFVPWSASHAALNPYEHLDPDDEESPLNRDTFENIKAQGWWMLAKRFALTYRAVMKQRGEPLEGDEDLVWDAADLISIPKELPMLAKLKKELAQPTMGQSGRMRMLVNKKPDGTHSPNLADAVMMLYWPMPKKVIPSTFVAPIIVGGE